MPSLHAAIELAWCVRVEDLERPTAFAVQEGEEELSEPWGGEPEAVLSENEKDTLAEERKAAQSPSSQMQIGDSGYRYL